MLLRQRRIVLLGDSLSVGSFPFMVAELRRLDGDNRAWLVAKVGAPTSWMFASAQIERVLSFDPTIVVVMGGTNDLAANTDKAADDARRNLGGIAASLNPYAEVFVSTVPPTSGKARGLTERFDAQLLDGVGAVVIDAGAAVPRSELGGDGVHPTSAGYAALGAALAREATHEPGLLAGLAMLTFAGVVIALPGV